MAEDSLLIPVSFSESRSTIITKCLCLRLEVAVSECEILCGYAVECTSGGNSEKPAWQTGYWKAL